MAEGNLYHIYSDESRQCQDMYMVIGGIIISSDDVAMLDETMKQYRSEMNMNAELKWSRVANQKYQEYERFVEYFFALSNTDKIHFRSITIDTHQINHKKFNSGDKDLGFISSITSFSYIVLQNVTMKQKKIPGLLFIQTIGIQNTHYKN